MNKLLLAVLILIVATVSFVIGGKWNNRVERDPQSVVASNKKETVLFGLQSPAPKITPDEARSHRERHYEDLVNVDDVLELPGDFAQTEALYTLAGRADATLLQQYIQQSVLIADRYERQAALGILFSRYAELDPQAAVDFLLLIDLDIANQIIGPIFQSYAKVDMNAAIVLANQLVNVRQRRFAGDAILTTAARTDPGMLEVVASQLADRHSLELFQSEAIGIRANFDAESALQEALDIANPNGRWDAIRRVGAVWARNDPAAAIATAQNIENLPMRQQFIAGVLNRWIGDDPEAAMQAILANPNSHERNRYLQTGLMSYAEIDPEKALLIASQLSGPVKSSAYQSIFSVWAAQDPGAAMQAYAVMEESPMKRGLLEHIGQSVANSDPVAALNWLDSLDPEQRAGYMPDFLAQMAQSDPQRALDAALASDSPDRNRALSRVLQQIAYSQPQLAIQYVAELPAGHERQNLYARLAENLAVRDPQAAMAFVSTLSGQAYLGAMQGVAGALATVDPELAASMVAQAPEGVRSELIGNISGAISVRDPESALAWLSRFRSNPAYDAAAATIAMNLAYRDPQYAMRIADGLGAEHRGQAIQNILANWAMNDPVAASRWAANTDANQRTEAIGNVVRVWAGMDPIAASRWVRSLRSGDAKDFALATLAVSTELDTHGIADLIIAIDSEAQRDQAIVSAYLRVRQQYNETAAAEFLDRVDANDNVRQQLSRYTMPNE